MEYSMNMYAKLLHTSISRIGSGGNTVKIYGNHTDFHIAYVVKKYMEEKKDMEKISISRKSVPGRYNCGGGRPKW